MSSPRPNEDCFSFAPQLFFLIGDATSFVFGLMVLVAPLFDSMVSIPNNSFKSLAANGKAEIAKKNE